MNIYSSSEPEPEELKEEVSIIFLMGLGNAISNINPLGVITISSL